MRTLIIALCLSALVAGCGDDDGGSGGRSTGEAGVVEDTVLAWMFEGGCQRMTDQFLEDQVLGIGDTRAENCELFEGTFQEPQFDEDDVKFSDVEVNDSEASLVVSDDFTNVETTYELVKESGRWRINSVDINVT